MQGGKPNNNRWNRLKNSVKQKVLDVIPEHTKKDPQRKLYKWAYYDNIISKPAENRAIMGITALMTQPFIDYNNKKVDKETRKIAFINRCAVILAGTGVGVFLVRGPVYSAIAQMTDVKGKNKYSKALLPKKYLQEIANNKKYLKNYRNALSMGIALGIMCVTNFVFDAPATIFLTNLMQDKFCKKKNQDKEVEHG